MTKLIAYKAFNKDWTCRDFRYVVGKSYKHEGDIELCERGFHACENPLDVLNYYDLTESKFAIVEVNRVKKQKGEESKIVSADIYIKAEIALPEFIKNSVNYLIDITKGKASSGDSAKQASSGYGAKQASSGDYAQQASSGDSAKQASSGDSAKQASSGYGAKQASSGDSAKQASSGDYAKQASSGDYAQQASSGDYAKQASSGYGAKQASSGYGAKQASSGYGAKQASSGDYAQQASSGYGAKQASSGYGAKQASSGDSAKHICEGEKSVIASSGRNTKAKGIKGTWIALAEYKYGECVGFATGCIGKKGLKPDTWYEARNGKLVEPLEKEISVEDMQKIVDANEKLVKEMKDADR